MTQDNWQDCPTMKSVVEAMERGDEVQKYALVGWLPYSGDAWCSQGKYRCRPAKPKTKTVVMREAFFYTEATGGRYAWISSLTSEFGFLRYTGNERTEEIPE